MCLTYLCRFLRYYPFLIFWKWLRTIAHFCMFTTVYSKEAFPILSILFLISDGLYLFCLHVCQYVVKCYHAFPIVSSWVVRPRNSLCGYFLILLLVKDAHQQKGHHWPRVFLPRPTVFNMLYLGLIGLLFSRVGRGWR